ncbi:hypothetical protein PRUB_b1108 [Pseudoalteromonas rubra]|uniref:Uncharacterized protein n=1 Tax=Pseudoalteromonas rubra TaxID=43658 RepID=A0A8T0C1L8_9GAMM|nr:hypothetical protein PRUB_b1108 [Pseudoalteromonas rubra]
MEIWSPVSGLLYFSVDIHKYSPQTSLVLKTDDTLLKLSA